MVKKSDKSKKTGDTEKNLNNNLVIQSSLKYKNFTGKRNNIKIVIVRPK